MFTSGGENLKTDESILRLDGRKGICLGILF